MKKVRIDELQRFMGPATVKRPVSRGLETEHMGINYYELEPGDAFSFGYHSHSDQEEVFYIQEGTVTFETDDGSVSVGAGEVVRFGPGEFQRGVNEGDERVVGLAIGAPQDGGELTLRRECADCGDRTPQAIERSEDGEALVTTCEGCGGVTGRFRYGEE